MSLFLLSFACLICAYLAAKFRRQYLEKKSILQRVQGEFWSPIRAVVPGELHPDLRETDIGTTLDSEVYLVGSGSGISVSTSDTEAWILSVLAKKSLRIFEWGTATGRTTYLLARNSPAAASVTTLTLPSTAIGQYLKARDDSDAATAAALQESHYQHFLYSGSTVESKITQLFCDSKQFAEDDHLTKYDLIFIDGSHAYSYVKNDTEKSLRMIDRGGLILWHDYRGKDSGTADVFTYLNHLAGELPLMWVARTSLVAYRHPL